LINKIKAKIKSKLNHNQIKKSNQKIKSKNQIKIKSKNSKN